MLRQIEWGVRNEPITKNLTFATDYIAFLKIQFEYKDFSTIVDLIYQFPIYTYVHTFRELFSFI